MTNQPDTLAQFREPPREFGLTPSEIAEAVAWGVEAGRGVVTETDEEDCAEIGTSVYFTFPRRLGTGWWAERGHETWGVSRCARVLNIANGSEERGPFGTMAEALTEIAQKVGMRPQPDLSPVDARHAELRGMTSTTAAVRSLLDLKTQTGASAEELAGLNSALSAITATIQERMGRD